MTDKPTLRERLRAKVARLPDASDVMVPMSLLTEAADRIERLEYENGRLRAADTRPAWEPETSLGEPDRNPND